MPLLSSRNTMKVRYLLQVLVALGAFLSARIATATDCGPVPFDQVQCFCQVPVDIPGIAVGHIEETDPGGPTYFEVDESYSSSGTPLFAVGDRLRVYQVSSFGPGQQYLLLNFSGDKTAYSSLVAVSSDGTVNGLGSNPDCRTALAVDDLIQVYVTADEGSPCGTQVRELGVPGRESACGDDGGNGCSAAGEGSALACVTLLMALIRRRCNA